MKSLAMASLHKKLSWDTSPVPSVPKAWLSSPSAPGGAPRINGRFGAHTALDELHTAEAK